MQFVGAVWLYHPAKNFKHDRLFLYPNGTIKSVGETDEICFGRNEDALFQKFLRSVPKPTFWDRTRGGRISFLGWTIIGSVCIGSGVLAYAAVRVLFGFK
jgi:hypothetical protein